MSSITLNVSNVNEWLAIYARFSGERQNETSAEDQIAACRQYGEKLGMVSNEANVFVDKALTGRTDDRAALQRLKAAAASPHKVWKHLVIWDTSRLARDTGDAADLRKYLEFHGVCLHFVKDGIRSDSGGFTMTHQIKAMMDEQYSVGISQNVHRGMIRQMERGYVPSGKCYGYDHVRDEDPSRPLVYGHHAVRGMRQVINPIQAAVILRIFTLYATGSYGYQAIAKILNEEDVPPPRRAHKDKHSGWNHAAIRGILNNKRYIGLPSFNKTRTVIDPTADENGKHRKLHRKRPQSEWVFREDQSLRIISDDLWNSVRDRATTNCKLSGHSQDGGHARTEAARRYIFSGKLLCGLCGGRMIMFGGKTGDYRCSNRQRSMGCHNTFRIGREALELQLLTKIAELVTSEVTFDALRTEFRSQCRIASQTEQRRLEQLCANREAFSEDRKTLDGKISNLVEVLATNPQSPGIMNGLRELEGKRAQYDALLATETFPAQHATEAEIDEFLAESLSSLASILRGDAIKCRQEIGKRVEGLILHSVVEDGRVKFKIEGFFKTFFGDEPLLLERTCQCITKQQLYNELNLDQLVLEGGRQSKNAKILAFPEPKSYSISQEQAA